MAFVTLPRPLFPALVTPPALLVECFFRFDFLSICDFKMTPGTTFFLARLIFMMAVRAYIDSASYVHVMREHDRVSAFFDSIDHDPAGHISIEFGSISPAVDRFHVFMTTLTIDRPFPVRPVTPAADLVVRIL
jgi:hypothetical protein